MITADQIDQLEGAELDLAVAEVVFPSDHKCSIVCGHCEVQSPGAVWGGYYSPSKQWQIAGSLLEEMAAQDKFPVMSGPTKLVPHWSIDMYFDPEGGPCTSDPSPTTAICRAYLKWKATA